ncbi:LCP family protein [Candidatus Saccharibacteria bacterium]|nr:LCP family protein [Candidatus Saccharibacteria bacterium]
MEKTTNQTTSKTTKKKKRTTPKTTDVVKNNKKRKSPTKKNATTKKYVSRPATELEAPAVQELESPVETEISEATPEETSESITTEANSKQEESVKHTKKSHKYFGRFVKTMAFLSIIGFIALLINVIRFNILPTKFLVIIIVGMVVLTALNLFLAFFKKKPLLCKSISLILSLIYLFVSIFAFFKINDTINFFSNFGADKDVNTYNVLVANTSELNEDSDLTDYEIQTYRDLMLDSTLVEEAMKSEIGATAVFTENILELFSYGLEDSSHVISLNAGTYEAFLADNDIYKDQFRIIKTFDVITDAENTSGIDVTKTPFAIYLSGIDTRSGTLPSRSLSDVNIVAAINPVEHKILLVAIPRDYYVHLHGTAEGSLNDKLTHAGSTGGVELSKATIEDLLDMKIDFYARVNFNFVENLVNAIGGITVNSDVDYTFKCWTNKNCVFHPGANPVDGRCALAFARERKAYSSGDRHRGENQEQVISLILDKITNSTTLLSNYSEILAALEGTFETSFNMDDVTKFFKNQLDEMATWTVESQNLDGKTGGAATYSYPAQKLSVMFPDEKSIEAAKKKINEVLGIEEPAEETSAENADTNATE